MNVAEFLRRIEYAGPTSPDEASLHAIHRAFMMAVPFENLDIHLRRRIVLDEEAFFEKVVRQNRGGFCFELNGLFAAALRELGFDVEILSARVFDDRGEMGRDFVHMLVLVRLERLWIADVGFGDWSADPLCLEPKVAQVVDGVNYRINASGKGYVVEHLKDANGGWKPRYSFDLTPRQLIDFVDICDDLQTAEDSAFLRRRMCTRCTPAGRITLTEEKLITTSGTDRREVPVKGIKAYREALAEHFGIRLTLRQVAEFR